MKLTKCDSGYFAEGGAGDIRIKTNSIGTYSRNIIIWNHSTPDQKVVIWGSDELEEVIKELQTLSAFYKEEDLEW